MEACIYRKVHLGIARTIVWSLIGLEIVLAELIVLLRPGVAQKFTLLKLDRRLDDFGRLSGYFLMLFAAIFEGCFPYAYKYNLFSNDPLCLALWPSPLENFVTCLAILSYAPRFQTLKLHVWIPMDAAVSA